MGPVLSLLFGETDDTIDHEAIKNAGDVYNTDGIFYGADGNLRFGRKPRDRKEELRLFSSKDVDDTVEENGKRWYIMDGPWIEAWLAFIAASNEDFCLPDPGPCDNRRLLQHNRFLEGWEARDGVKSANGKGAGDYRRVSEAAWKLYCEKYPGSGPAISVVANILSEEQLVEVEEGKAADIFDDGKEGGDDPYDPKKWEIDQTTYVPPPNKEELLKKVFAEKEAEDVAQDGLDLLRLQGQGPDSDDDVAGSDDEAPPASVDSDDEQRQTHVTDSDDEG